jgi:hypothetical protein
MVKANWKSSVVLAALLAVTATTGCRVRQTQEGKAPEVDVKGGQVPKYDVDPAEVTIKGEKREVTVPKVDVKTEKREVTVPDVSVKMPPKEPSTNDQTPPQQ